MTDNTEPTIDGEVRNIIGQIPNYVLGYLEISDGIKQEWADNQRAYLQLYSDKVKALIANQVREELTNLKIARLNLGTITTDHADGYQMAVDDMNRHIDNRIKELKGN